MENTDLDIKVFFTIDHKYLEKETVYLASHLSKILLA